MQPFDLENFQTEFARTLETPQASLHTLQMMVDAIAQNPDMAKEICEAASTALRTVVAKKLP